MKKYAKIISVLLIVMLSVSMLAACGGGSNSGGSGDSPLVVGYSNFSSKFSPFFASSAYDMDAMEMTQLSLLTSDRTGAIIKEGIKGETIPYNGKDYTYTGVSDLKITENADGTVFYDVTLRDDLKFSDGEPITIDDVIFSMYVFCDPTYDGSTTLFSQPIKGMKEYRSGVETKFDLLIKAGKDNTDFTNWDEATQKKFFEDLDKAKVTFIKEIKAYLVTQGAVKEDSPLADVAKNWGYDGFTGTTEAELFDKMVEKYNGSVKDMIGTESAGSAITDLIPDYESYQVGIQTGNSAPNIEGIQKTGDYSLRVVSEKVDATLIYQLNVYVAPLHYYGDKAQYDYEKNMFGFPKGDLSIIRSKTTKPLGAGPYKFIKFENGVISYEANENYYKGAPKTKYINFREVNDTDKLNGIVTGTIDITDPSFSKDTAEAIMQANGGELSGKKVTTNTVDNLGYGYIGINSHNVSVAGEPGSEASKNLRRAFATIFSVNRDVAVDSYYGEGASVINYPISNTSWAAPQPTDDGYAIAFSKDAEGNAIYTSDMDADAKKAAAEKAALGFLEKAGYTVADGKVTAAPEGAKMEYEILIPADGSGDHPSFMILTLAKEQLAKIGINLIVTDLTNSSDLWDKLDAHSVEMWCAAWQATVDPDMYQIYYSDIANGGKQPGGTQGHYQIEDPELDKLILDGRASTNQEYRKGVYKAALDKIIEWACEIPVYQRQNAIVFSTEKVNIETVTPDITTFYGWMREIEKLEMNK